MARYSSLYHPLGWFSVGFCVVLFFGLGGESMAQVRTLHPWLTKKPAASRDWLQHRVAPPPGFQRVAVRAGSFAWWLRRLPMMPEGTPIRDFRGRISEEQSHRAGVFRLDVGQGDLQQCADVVMRLWSEYLWYRGLQRHVEFRLTSGHRNPWIWWARGDRLRLVRGQMRGWSRKEEQANASYSSFRRYLRVVMMYSGTASLSRELPPISRTKIQAGDLLLQGGFPGHVILLLDEARNAKGERRFLLGQGLMPAQSFHLVQPQNQPSSPWFSLPEQGPISTPSWDYPRPQFFRLRHVPGTR